MNWRNIRIVYRKELRDSLRDRRTLISMIVVPVVAMPLLMFGMGALMVKTISKAREEIPKVMVLGGEDSPKVLAALRAAKSIRLVPPGADFTNQIVEKRIRAAVEIPRDFDAALARGDAAVVRIYHYASEVRSDFASGNLEQFFRNLRDATVRERLQARSIPPQVLKPFDIVQQNVAPPAKVSGNTLGGLIPYLIIIFCMTGAMYPATDLTAGEKERGTMETILCSPVSRTELVLGKFLMVLTASLGTVLLSLLSLGGNFQIARHVLTRALPQPPAELALSLDPVGVAGVFLMLLPVAVMLSAVLLAVSLFARSFREAQSYTGPLMIVVILPAMIGLLPGVELNARLALVPLVNVSLVCKEMMVGMWHWSYILLIFGSSCLYAAAALAWAVWLFQREEVLFRT
jgi:sodium transport system permease protein